MNTQSARQSALELAINYEFSQRKIRLWESPTEKRILVLSAISFVVAVVTGWMYSTIHQPIYAEIALWAVLAMYLSGIAYVVVSVIPVLKTMGNQETIVTEMARERFHEEFSLIQRLTNLFDLNELTYSVDRLNLIIEHFKFRIYVLAGPLDKIGLIPMVFGAAVTIIKLNSDIAIPTNWLLYGGAALIALFLLAVSSINTAQQLERRLLVLRHAIARKQEL